MENVRPWCGQPLDRGRLKKEQNLPVFSIGCFHRWQFGAAVTVLAYQRSCPTSCPVSMRMGDHLHAGIPPRYVTSHPGQLSLAISPWVGTAHTGDGFGHR